MVELYVDGQHDDRRQGAEPHKQDTWRRGRELAGPSYGFLFYKSQGQGSGVWDNQGNACMACNDCGWEKKNKTNNTVSAVRATIFLLLLHASREAETNEDCGGNQACD